MGLYSILLMPAFVLALFSVKLSRFGVGVVWFLTSVIMFWLVPLGSRDYSVYVEDFLAYRELGIFDVIGKDPLYAVSTWGFGKLGCSPEIYFSFLIPLVLLVKLVALKRLGASSAVVFVYMSSYFFLHEFTQFRAGLAIGLLMHAIVDFSFGRKRFFALTVLAILVHIQAILGILLFSIIYLSRFRGVSRAIFCIFIVGVLLGIAGVADQVFIAVAAQFPDARAEIYLRMAEEGYWDRPNVFSAINIIGLVTAFACALYFRRTSGLRACFLPSNMILLCVSTSLFLGVLAITTLGSVSVAAFRVSEHFFALLPLGVGLVLNRLPLSPRLQQCILFSLGALLFFIFIFHSEYLRDPITGV